MAAPKGLLPHLIVNDARAAVAFYTEAFGATDAYTLTMGEAVMHGEVKLFGSRIMVADEFPNMNLLSPLSREGTTVSISVYVDDVDSLAERAINAGATLERPIKDEFFGDRVARLVDPFGHRWALHQQLEEVTPEEMQKRMEALFT